MNWKKYSKFWVALGGAAVAFLTIQFGADNTYVQVVVALLTSLGVYAVPNAS